MIWMQPLGAAVLAITLVSGIILVVATKFETRRIIALTFLGIFGGIALLFADHVISAETKRAEKPVVDDIKVIAQKIRDDASAVNELRDTIERQRDEIALVVQDAKKVGTELNKAQKLTNMANEKLAAMAQIVSEGEQRLKRLDLIVDFSMLLAKATNDDRYAFDMLVEIAKSEGSFNQIANRAVIEIANNISRQIRTDPKFPWYAYNIDPEKAPIQEWRSIYSHVHEFYRPSFLSEFWQQIRFEKRDRLEFLYQIIRSDGSLKTVHRACMLMNQEANLNKNILAKELYMQWWEKEKTIDDW
jgi:hypothetical protein